MWLIFFLATDGLQLAIMKVKGLEQHTSDLLYACMYTCTVQYIILTGYNTIKSLDYYASTNYVTAKKSS